MDASLGILKFNKTGFAHDTFAHDAAGDTYLARVVVILKVLSDVDRVGVCGIFCCGIRVNAHFADFFQIVAAVKDFFFDQFDGPLRNNPADGVMAENRKASGKKSDVRHALSTEEQRAFLKFVEESDVFGHWLVLFIVLFGTGCRIGELLGLRWDDIDFANRIIDINHSLIYLCHGKGTGAFIISTPKTESGTRTIPMLDRVYEALLEEYEIQKKEGFNSQVIDGMTGFIFKNRYGTVLNPSSVNRAIRRIYEAYNAGEILDACREHREPLVIPHFSCHHVRHTFATRLCESETNLKAIQSIMGHANIKTTMDIYAEATKERNAQAMDNLEDNLFF